MVAVLRTALDAVSSTHPVQVTTVLTAPMPLMLSLPVVSVVNLSAIKLHPGVITHVFCSV